MSLEQRIFNFFLSVYLIVSMSFYVPGQMAYIPQENFFQYFSIVFMALSFYVPAKRSISNVWIGLFLLYAVLNTVFLSFTPASRITLLNVFLGCFSLKTIAERVDLDFKKYGYILLGFVALNIFQMSLQVLNVDPIFTNVHFDKMPQVDVVGFMGIRFCLGILAAFCLPFVFSISPWHCIALLPLLYFSKASTVIAAFFASFMFLMWFKNRKAFLLMALLLGSAFIGYVFFYDAPTGQFSKRFEVWLAGMSVFKMKPWFGLGLGSWNDSNFVTMQENGVPEKWAWAHNEFLQYLFEQGILGAFILFKYFKNLFSNIKFDDSGRVVFSLILSLSIVSIFHFPFHIGRFAAFSVFILALAEAYKSERLVNEKIISYA